MHKASAALLSANSIPFCWDLLYNKMNRRVAALVLITSPTGDGVCVLYSNLTLPVTCNNNTPILQHGGFYGQIC